MNTKTQNNISVGYGNHWPSGCVFIAPCPALFYLEGNMQEKKCSKCGEVKDVSEFYEDRRKDGRRAQPCKTCEKTRCFIRYKTNIEYREKLNQRSKKRSKDNPEKTRMLAMEWRAKNPDKSKLVVRRSSAKRRSTIGGKLNHSLSVEMQTSLKGNKSGRHWETIVGYTIDQLKKHLEKQFKNGMSWENYGKHGWHIDHKIPISVHNFETPYNPDFKNCWSLKNLQPMWAKENISKSNKLSKPFQPSLTI